jgi:hypothetical protein
MGLIDKLKGLVGGHKDQAEQGVDKAADLADDKTGGSHSDQIATAAEKTNEEIDNLGDSG